MIHSLTIQPLDKPSFKYQGSTFEEMIGRFIHKLPVENQEMLRNAILHSNHEPFEIPPNNIAIYVIQSEDEMSFESNAAILEKLRKFHEKKTLV